MQGRSRKLGIIHTDDYLHFYYSWKEFFSLSLVYFLSVVQSCRCFPQPCIYIIVDVVSHKWAFSPFVFVIILFFVKVLNNLFNQFSIGVFKVMAIFNSIFFLRVEVVANADFRKHLSKNLNDFNN